MTASRGWNSKHVHAAILLCHGWHSPSDLARETGMSYQAIARLLRECRPHLWRRVRRPWVEYHVPTPQERMIGP